MMAFAVVLHVGILLTLKYSRFFITNVNALFQFFPQPVYVERTGVFAAHWDFVLHLTGRFVPV